jgi:regulation of enolase protein 1 (concanavalin A-like superfamily)
MVFKDKMSIYMQHSSAKWGSRRGGGPVWSTGTFRHAAKPVCLHLSQSGELSLVDRFGKVHWQSARNPPPNIQQTSGSGSPAAHPQLSLNDDGVAVVMTDIKAESSWSTSDARQYIAGGERLMPDQKLSSMSGNFWLLLHQKL